MAGKNNIHHGGKRLPRIQHIKGGGGKLVVFQAHVGITDFMSALGGRNKVPLLRKAAVVNDKLDLCFSREGDSEHFFTHRLIAVYGERYIRSVGPNGGDFIAGVDLKPGVLLLPAGVLKLKPRLTVNTARFRVGTHVGVSARAGDGLQRCRAKEKIIVHLRRTAVNKGLAHIEQDGTGRQCRR